MVRGVKRMRGDPDQKEEPSIPVGEQYGYLNLKLSQQRRDQGYTLDNEAFLVLKKDGKVVARFAAWLPLDQVFSRIERQLQAGR